MLGTIGGAGGAEATCTISGNITGGTMSGNGGGGGGVTGGFDGIKSGNDNCGTTSGKLLLKFVAANVDSFYNSILSDAFTATAVARKPSDSNITDATRDILLLLD